MKKANKKPPTMLQLKRENTKLKQACEDCLADMIKWQSQRNDLSFENINLKIEIKKLKSLAEDSDKLYGITQSELNKQYALVDELKITIRTLLTIGR